MSYLLRNSVTGLFAAHDCAGQHDGKFTDDPANVKEFATYGEASDYSQNFDDNWQPEPMFLASPPVSFGHAERNEIPLP